MRFKYGIDFGTTNTSIAVCQKIDGRDKPDILSVSELGNRLTMPSVIYIDDINTEGYSVGDDAIQDARTGKFRYGVEHVKLVKKIKLDLEEKKYNALYSVGNRNVNIIQMISFIFKHLKQSADLQADILISDMTYDGVVLGVPVEFGDIEKGILAEALYLAGFYKSNEEAQKKTEFVSEPIAVAIQYGLNLEDDQRVLVFDFGGGTLDIAIIDLKNQVNIDKLHPHKALAKKRITLGGEELTKLFFTEVVAQAYDLSDICTAYKIPYSHDPEKVWYSLLNDSETGYELIDAVEHIKQDLSDRTVAKLHTQGILDAKRFEREDFEYAIRDKLDEIKVLIDDCIMEAGFCVNNHIDVTEIDTVVLAGGSSLIPCVQELLRKKFGFAKLKAGKPLDVLTSIVQGLSIVGMKEDSIVSDVVDNDYGIWDDDRNCFLRVIEKGIPVSETRFDRITQNGKYQQIETSKKNARDVKIQVFQNNLNGITHIGNIHFNDVGSGNYKLFMSVDAKKGTLSVNLYDVVQRRWNEIPIDQSEFKIK